MDNLSVPAWPTAKRGRLPGGRLLGTDGSMWLYRRLPMGPMVDARSTEVTAASARPLAEVLNELADMTAPAIARRRLARSRYRAVHILSLDVPAWYSPPANHPIREHLARSFAQATVRRRLVLLGIRIVPSITSGGLRHAVASVAESLAVAGTPIEDFDADYRRLDDLCARSGLSLPTPADIWLADSWWASGARPDVGLVEHVDHLHVFADAAAMSCVDALGPDCTQWADSPAGAHAVSLYAAANFELAWVDETDPAARWVPVLFDIGALAISVRGLLEPPAVTRAELRRARKSYLDDLNERANAGKMSRSEQDETLSALTDMEATYSAGGPGTLVDTSIVVAVNGRDTDKRIPAIAKGLGFDVLPMTNRQRRALAETWVTSRVRANPHLEDMPAHVIASSGLTNLSSAGDPSGVLLGFTERDRQPVYVSSTGAADVDQVPVMVVAGQSGSGKTMTMVHMAVQMARLPTAKGEKTPVVVLDLKSGSDLSDVIVAAGGQVASLDDLISGDGIFDPLRFAPNKAVAQDWGTNLLTSINPWGRARGDFEAPLASALGYGIAAGASCIGQALSMAAEAGEAHESLVGPVLDLARVSSTFAACVGMTPGTTALRMAEGLTLVKAGETYLDLSPSTDPSLGQRVAAALVRMMVFGSAMALSGRQGVLMVDEAWVVFQAGMAEVERLGRIARSQQVFPVLFTQRVSDAVNAGMSGYISQGLLMAFTDRAEATAGCELFRIEATPERLERMLAKEVLGDGVEQSPNWASMRALRQGPGGKVLRGSLATFVDLAGRATVVEIAIPPDVLALASTNPEDMRRRARATSSAS